MATKKRDRRIRSVEESLLNPLAPRKEPLPAPAAGIFDSPYTCVRVNRDWLGHVLGCVDVLAEPDAWTGDADERRRAHSEIVQFMVELAEGSCMQITDIRLSGCSIEVEYYDAPGIWVPVGDIAACASQRDIQMRSVDVGGGCYRIDWKRADEAEWAELQQICDGAGGADGRQIELNGIPVQNNGDTGLGIQWRYVGDASWMLLGIVLDGADGADGADGTDGADGADGVCPGCGGSSGAYAPIVGDDWDADAACAVAEGLSEFIDEWFDETMTDADAGVQLGKTIARIATEIADGIPIIGSLGGVVYAFIEEYYFDDFIDLRETTDAEFIQWLKCELYRRLFGVNELTLATLENLLYGAGGLQDALFALPPWGGQLVLVGQAVGAWLPLVTVEEYLRRANFYASGDGYCFDCGNMWCVDFDFTENAQGWAIVDAGYGPRGHYAAGTGFVSDPEGEEYENVHIHIQFSASTITSVQATVQRINGPEPNTDRIALRYLGSNVVNQVEQAGSGVYEISWIGEQDNIDELFIALTTGQDTGELIIINARVCGNGVNPFE
jgi:hypothetical protein